MRKSVIVGCCLAILALFFAEIYSRHNTPTIQAAAQTSSAAAVNDLPPPQAETKTETGYKLVVGANPRFNSQQKFSPPTNSVVITNGEEQLRQLVEQTRPRQNTNAQ